MSSKSRMSLGIFILFLLGDLLQTISAAESKTDVHIVYMGEKPNGETPEATRKSHHEMLSAMLGSKKAARNSIIYSYKHGFSGFAARLTVSQAEKIAELPGVIHVFPNRIHKLRTTRSWDFLGLDHTSSRVSLLTEANMGNGTIIGIIDSGIWPESESFNDKGMGPVPSHWKGICQEGQAFGAGNCNKKLIGARWFLAGNYSDNSDYLSPRDAVGHGTHCASTAAGRLVKGVSYNGLASARRVEPYESRIRSLSIGGAPLARLAVYKACWIVGGCTDADMLKAFDTAIHDGVNVISTSVGPEGLPLYSYGDEHNGIAIGSFHATRNGITVVTAGGNEGPYAYSVENTAPWLITVAAAKVDRAFPTSITLGNKQILTGQSLDPEKLVKQEFSRLAFADDDEAGRSCQPESLNKTLTSGKVVLCFSTQGKQTIDGASAEVTRAGGIGVIYAQFGDNALNPCDKIPCVRVDYEVGTQILSYIREARLPVVKLSPPRTVLGESVSPRIAHFSSRGPSTLTPSVLKPDIAAPGVDILAAYPPVPPLTSITRSYAFSSGTSMATPHVAGIVTLIKSARPDWSPEAIRSALVTTATQKGTDGSDITEVGLNRKVADPFDMGGGLVNPNKAVDPGLIYNITTEEYIQFLCALSYSSQSIARLVLKTTDCKGKSGASILNLNLPSITIPNYKNKTTVTRTVTNVGDVANSVYKVIVEAPQGIEMVVEPSTLRFDTRIRVVAFKVTFLAHETKMNRDYKFGSLTWTDGKHIVRSPVSVRVTKFDYYADV